METTGLEIRKEAALALDAGVKLAQRAAQMRRGLPVDGEVSGAELGDPERSGGVLGWRCFV